MRRKTRAGKIRARAGRITTRRAGRIRRRRRAGLLLMRRRKAGLLLMRRSSADLRMRRRAWLRMKKKRKAWDEKWGKWEEKKPAKADSKAEIKAQSSELPPHEKSWLREAFADIQADLRYLDQQNRKLEDNYDVLSNDIRNVKERMVGVFKDYQNSTQTMKSQLQSLQDQVASLTARIMACEDDEEREAKRPRT